MTHDKIDEFTTEEFDRTFKTNVYALFWLSRAALPQMKPGSAIVNTLPSKPTIRRQISFHMRQPKRQLLALPKRFPRSE
jgi:NAD(P)-dependent dehydrogenase (short-subunit alcohol dehydrogenase family)